MALLARAADIWEAKLGNADAAGELLEKILEREPGYVPALTRLARIYEPAGDWEKCEATLGRALALRPVGREAADLYFRLARVHENKAGDPAAGLVHIEQALGEAPKAKSMYERGLELDPGHAGLKAAMADVK